MTRNIRYATRIMRARLLGADRSCPYCGSLTVQRVGWKHVLLTLYECTRCGLKYRFPKDDPVEAQAFYESEYAEKTVVDTPTDPELSVLLQNGFARSQFDKSSKINFISKWMEPSASILDYGASFGYTVCQLRAAGFCRVIGYELSPTRARYGREKIGVEVYSDLAEIERHAFAPLDCIYSSHVLEHLPDLKSIFPLFARLLKPGGMLIVWTPNASEPSLREHYGGSWAALVGEPHTVALDYDFLERALRDHNFDPVHQGPREHSELCVVARRA